MKSPAITAARLALTTASSQEEAQKIARQLVESRLAACVNIVPHVQSIYRWQGAVESAAEFLLLIKTSGPLIELLESELRKIHSYELPEFLVLPVEAGSEPYLQWIAGNLQNPPDV